MRSKRNASSRRENMRVSLHRGRVGVTTPEGIETEMIDSEANEAQMRENRSTNPELIAWVRQLHSHEGDVPLLMRVLADRLEAAEAKLARLEPEPERIRFSDSLPNDGMYEYTRSSDCDGTNPVFQVRRPATFTEPGPWYPISASDYRESSRRWRGHFRPVDSSDDFCDLCAGPYETVWPYAKYGGHWETCPNRKNP